jgi:hypothetical protein
MSMDDDRAFLMEGANAQDSLLQSYRGIHATIQSILLALGVGLTVLPLTLDPYPSTSPPAVVSGVILLAIWALQLFSSRKLRAVVIARGKDVNHWQRELIKLEQRLKPRQRYFTAFKVHQQSRRKDLAYLQQTYLSEQQLTEAQVEEMIGKGLGHTRRVVDEQLFTWIGVVWLLLVITTWGPMLWLWLR